MKIVIINSLHELKGKLHADETNFLLLYKRGGDISECALKNISNIGIGSINIYSADVSLVRDIHSEFNIKTVPSFMEFKGFELKNIYKGCHETEFFNNLLIGSVFKKDYEEKQQKRVTVYSTPSCSWCTRLKVYLDSKSVKYKDIDISKNQKIADDLVKRSGQKGVPQTEINGKIIVGFDQVKLDSMLGI
ncbi:MAG: hypothetical protein KAH10_01425 [Flavobacteriales bacterium]|nr:hypothetical protein [Flavobacteriales bacterium]